MILCRSICGDLTYSSWRLCPIPAGLSFHWHEEQARLQAVRNRDSPSVQVRRNVRGQMLAACLPKQPKPAPEQGGADALDGQMSGERVSFVAAGLEHDRGPEIPDHGQMLRPFIVGDRARENRPERRVPPDLLVE